jgi:two-component system response regulator FixJ
MTAGGLVHLIDDDEDVRRALSFLLGTAGLAVKVYESASIFLEKCDDFQSGCIVSDVRMPGIDGLELLRQLRNRRARMPVVIMTGHADVLLAAIGAAVDREQRTGRPGAEVQVRLASLTAREKEVLDGLLAGHPNKTIAYDLGLSPRTVEVHRANVMMKMGATSLSELVRMALAAGYF